MTADFLHSYLLFLSAQIVDCNYIEECINNFVLDENKELCIGWIFIIAFEKTIFYLNTVQDDKYQKELTLLIQLMKILTV